MTRASTTTPLQYDNSVVGSVYLGERTIKAEHKTFGIGTILALDGDRVYIEFARGERKTISRDGQYWLTPPPADLSELPTLRDYLSAKTAQEDHAELQRKEAVKKVLTAGKKSRPRAYYRAPLKIRNANDAAILSLFLAGQDDFKVLAKRCETTVRHVKEVLIDRGLIDAEPIKKSKPKKNERDVEQDEDYGNNEDISQIWQKLSLRERLDWLRQNESGIPCFAVRHSLSTILRNYGAEKLEASLQRLVTPIREDAMDDDYAVRTGDDETLVGDELL